MYVQTCASLLPCTSLCLLLIILAFLRLKLSEYACIDGTTNFAHCYPSFAVSVGVLFQGKPAAAAVVFDHNLNFILPVFAFCISLSDGEVNTFTIAMEELICS